MDFQLKILKNRMIPGRCFSKIAVIPKKHRAIVGQTSSTDATTSLTLEIRVKGNKIKRMKVVVGTSRRPLKVRM